MQFIKSNAGVITLVLLAILVWNTANQQGGFMTLFQKPTE